MVVPISITSASGLFAIVFNRWYMSVGNIALNIVLLLLSILITLILLLFLTKKINEALVNDTNLYRLVDDAEEINKWIEYSKNLYWKLSTLLIISTIMSFASCFIFLAYSVLVGLPISIGTFILAFLLVKYVNLPQRSKALKGYTKLH